MYQPVTTNFDPEVVKKIITDNCILIGDLNCKHISWGSSTNNRGGIKLYQNIGNLKIKVKKMKKNFLCTTTGKLDVIDTIITSDSPSFVTSPITTHPDIGSDHLPFSFTLSNIHNIKTRNPPLTLYITVTTGSERLTYSHPYP